MQLIEYYEIYFFERRKIDQYLQGGNVSTNVPSASEREVRLWGGPGPLT